MAHEVESMFSVREKPWHYEMTKEVTKILQEAPTSSEALELAGLNWQVLSKPVYNSAREKVLGYKMNVRSSDNSVLGIVSSKYKIVQNEEAFAFTDALIGEGCRWETAGSLNHGKKIWLLAKLPDRKVLGEAFEPYICFTNTHDGTGAVRACMTPIRVVCNNTLNAALQGTKRAWSTPHRGDVSARLEEARETLMLADRYMIRLDEEADRLANEKMDDGQVHEVLDKMFELPEDATDRQKATVEKAKDEIIVCMLRPDLAQFLNTKWGFINAVSDYVGHADPARHTQNFEENRWGNIINGHPLFDKAVAFVR